jgi:hypothetical protein
MALTREQVVCWVERTCAEQGVPVYVSDPVTIAQVVTLLRGGTTERTRAERGSTGRPARSDPPDGPHAGWVERSPGDLGLVDDGVVEDGLHDGGLPGEVQG